MNYFISTPPAGDQKAPAQFSQLPSASLLKSLPFAVPGKYSSNRVSAGKSRKSKRAVPYLRKQPKDGQVWNTINGCNPVPRTRLIPDNSVYHYVQSVEGSILLTGSNTVPTYASWYFTLSLLDQVTSLTSVFDQYRVAMIETWVQASGISDGNSVANSSKWLSVIDYDDETNLTSFNAGLDYTNCIETALMVGHYRRFTPHVAVAAYSGAFTSYSNVTAPWIDCGSTSVRHYGLKVAAQQMSTAVNLVLQYRVHIEFKNVR